MVHNGVLIGEQVGRQLQAVQPCLTLRILAQQVRPLSLDTGTVQYKKLGSNNKNNSKEI